MITGDSAREAGEGGTVPLGQHGWRVVVGEDLARLEVGLTQRVWHWPGVLRDVGLCRQPLHSSLNVFAPILERAWRRKDQ